MSNLAWMLCAVPAAVLVILLWEKFKPLTDYDRRCSSIDSAIDADEAASARLAKATFATAARNTSATRCD